MHLLGNSIVTKPISKLRVDTLKLEFTKVFYNIVKVGWYAQRSGNDGDPSKVTNLIG